MTIAQILRDALDNLPLHGFSCWAIEGAAPTEDEANQAIWYYQAIAWSGPDGEGVPSLNADDENLPETAPKWWSRSPERYELARHAMLEMAALSAEREGV